MISHSVTPMVTYLPVNQAVNTVETVTYNSRPAAIPTNSPIVKAAPHSSILRAVADANQRSAELTIREQRDLADQLQAVESKNKIVEAINNSVKEEEEKIIDAANRRMAEVHARKEQEATKAAKAIEEAQKETAKKIEELRKAEIAKI